MPVPEDTRPIVLSCEVDPYHDQWTLIDFLCDRFRYLDRETWTDRIERGRVRVNGSAGAGPLTLRVGDTVEYEVHVEAPETGVAKWLDWFLKI